MFNNFLFLKPKYSSEHTALKCHQYMTSATCWR
jgi:hypothetical protein